MTRNDRDLPPLPRGPQDTVQRPLARIDHGGTPHTVAQPNGAPRAGIVVVQEAWGVTGYIEWLLRVFADVGYVAAAPHLYHRRGDVVIEDHDFAKARPVMTSLNGEEIAADIGNATGFLREAGAPRVGIIGFCMGGTIALWAAAHADVDAAVTFYGSGIDKPRWSGFESGLETAASVRVPWLGFYGDADRSIPPAQVERLRTAIEPVNAPTQIVRYPGAGHAFASDPSSPKHVREAAEDAGIRTREFLAAHLG
ncbi:dienelactone hydrolase family protein [Tomitella cavernea]|uniref:Dienelactone hydrolase domain-containing protein n=1 Tax=Tomitella cavernea TaxID=1387982 RepID=A0ABP9C8K3_9ACTN|nr:dienelactone hydrolase family protein [Tomitella cavernea]